MKTEVAAIVAASGTGVLVLLVREFHTARIERKRSQPIVIIHEQMPLSFIGAPGGWDAYATLTNDGGGSAFNVRFGIELRKTRFPHRSPRDDSPHGTRMRVVRVGNNDLRAHKIQIASVDVWGAGALAQDGKLHTSAVYWSRCQNASGNTWETRNPVDQAADLAIRRIRFPRVRERSEERRRQKVRRDGVRHERAMVDDLAERRAEDSIEQ